MVDDAAAGVAGSADEAGTVVAGVADGPTAGVAGFADDTGIVYVKPHDWVPTHGQTLSPKELLKLRNDIVRDGGILNPVNFVVHNGKKYVVDGHHRLIIAKQLGMEAIKAVEVQLPFSGYRTVVDLEWTRF
jgi:hypothetical protein